MNLDCGNFAVWCDQCADWVSEVIPAGHEILCADCRNCLLIRYPEPQKQKIRIDIAKAIWGLN